MAVSGASTKEAMDHIGWASKSSFKRYSRISKMMDRGSVSSLMKTATESQVNSVQSVFESLNATVDF